ncbi:MAG: ankyrin repeat domain-containing protein [Candidatus Eremiobacteraeota bacterium]|nr:ankyrin repeat domain-containing protein [Candidatus Eremiobacteraeota bacterium]
MSEVPMPAGRLFLGALVILALLCGACARKIERMGGSLYDRQFREINGAVRKADYKEVSRILAKEPGLAKAQDSCGYGALHWASLDGSKDIVTLLLAQGAPVNMKSKDGVTPLHCASRTGRHEVVSLLVKSGADLDVKTSGGDTPLSLAESGKHREVCRFLRNHGAHN